MRQLLATPCVALSLTLVALGGSNPMTIMGPILDTVAISSNVEGTSYEESSDA
jgi:hypothetical protein